MARALPSRPPVPARARARFLRRRGPVEARKGPPAGAAPAAPQPGHEGRRPHWRELRSPYARRWLQAFFAEAIPWAERVSGRALSRFFFDASCYRYGPGDYLKPHRDAVQGRALAFVIVLRDLRPEDGGRLLYLRGGKEAGVLEAVPHRRNSFVLFEVGPKSLHRIEPLRGRRRRLSVSGWFYPAERDRHLFGRAVST